MTEMFPEMIILTSLDLLYLPFQEVNHADPWVPYPPQRETYIPNSNKSSRSEEIQVGPGAYTSVGACGCVVGEVYVKVLRPL